MKPIIALQNKTYVILIDNMSRCIKCVYITVEVYRSMLKFLLQSCFTFLLIVGLCPMQLIAQTLSEGVDESASIHDLIKKIPIGSKSYPVFLTFSGYVDVYYSYNVIPDALRNSDSSVAQRTNTNRVFDVQHNAFTLGLIQTRLDIGNDDWQIVADLVHGPNAELGNFGNISESGSLTSTTIKQAYVSANFKGVTLTVGQYNTHVGYEVIEAYLNSHYSLSYAFGAGPFYHVGAKLEYSPVSWLGLMVGIVNGWDSSLNGDLNQAKSFAAQASLFPWAGSSIYINYVVGKESEENGLRNIIDLTSSYVINPFISLGSNVVFGTEYVTAKQAADLWFGAAAYIDYTINPDKPIVYMLSLRLEYFRDENNVRIFEGNAIGLTLTGTISFFRGAFLLKPEIRFDRASQDNFFRTSQYQTTVALASIGTF